MSKKDAMTSGADRMNSNVTEKMIAWMPDGTSKMIWTTWDGNGPLFLPFSRY